jgi:hypothetical protein
LCGTVSTTDLYVNFLTGVFILAYCQRLVFDSLSRLKYQAIRTQIKKWCLESIISRYHKARLTLSLSLSISKESAPTKLAQRFMSFGAVC